MKANVLLVSLFALSAAICASCITRPSGPVQSAEATQRGSLVAVRYNQLGYKPNAKKTFIVLSEKPLASKPWKVAGPEQLSGTLAASVAGPNIHTAQSHNYRLELAGTALTVPGEYTLDVDGTRVSFRVAHDPYGPLFAEALRHVTVERSGVIGRVLPPRTGNSHTFDKALQVHVSDGELGLGNWKARTPGDAGDTVDVLGGHYDAGDYLTFTLIEAYTTYMLTLAHELRASADLKNEIDYSLRYLDKLLVPDPKDRTRNLFVVQKGNESDHGHWPGRMPEADTPSSPSGVVRPALVAKSKCQMGITAAALARAARSIDDSRGYLAKAKQVYAEAKASPLTDCAFESAKTNDFYRDEDFKDQMKLAAAELYLSSGEPQYLNDATKTFAVGASSGGLSWATVNVLANLALWEHDPASKEAAIAEVDGYVNYAAQPDNVWRAPSGYVWGTMNSWMAQAVAAGLRDQKDEHAPSRQLMLDVLGYALGQNNWGLSFVYSNNPLYTRTARELHDQIYSLSHYFPSGVFSEGPTSLSTHCSQESAGSTCGPGKGWVPLLADPRCKSGNDDYDLMPFNSTLPEGSVYCDSREDYTTSEPVTYAQALGMLLAALADCNGACRPKAAPIPGK